MIKPIETVYNGYRFRSRLEARWAVFFDALGIKYEYESEGYDLGEAGWYLPDFWLPEIECFAEIKPKLFAPMELEKACRLPGPCLILDGTPEYKPLMSTISTSYEEGYIPESIHSAYARYIRGDYYDCIDIIQSISKKRLFFHWITNGFTSEGIIYPELLKAVARSRQARFEHGETP